jgi:hypothetical protein
MGAAATLSATTLLVEPGEEATCEITVRNTGTVVDQFSCEVIGDAAGWATVEPSSVSLFPGTEENVTVKFRPPRDYHVLAGPVDFGAKIEPQEDPTGATVEEGVVEVAAFVDTTAELLPRTTRGRRRTVHELALDNRGNATVNAKLVAVDADELLGFSIDPPTLSAPPGHAAFAKVHVAARKRFWRGPPKTHPFQVIAEPENGVSLALDGTMLQEAVLPKWLGKALLALLLLALLLVGAWFAFLRPALESAARAAAEEELAEVREEQAAVAAQAAAAEERAAAAEQAAADATAAAEEGAAGAGDGAGQENPLTDALLDAQGLGDPFDFRLARSVVTGGTSATSFTVPTGQRLALTDILLQNPGGDRGVMQILRDSGDFSSVLLEVRLQNFRDLDYHFVSPVVFQEGQRVVMNLRCRNRGTSACNAAAYFSGFVKDNPAEPEG